MTIGVQVPSSASTNVMYVVFVGSRGFGESPGHEGGKSVVVGGESVGCHVEEKVVVATAGAVVVAAVDVVVAAVVVVVVVVVVAVVTLTTLDVPVVPAVVVPRIGLQQLKYNSKMHKRAVILILYRKSFMMRPTWLAVNVFRPVAIQHLLVPVLSLRTLPQPLNQSGPTLQVGIAPVYHKQT